MNNVDTNGPVSNASPEASLPQTHKTHTLRNITITIVVLLYVALGTIITVVALHVHQTTTAEEAKLAQEAAYPAYLPGHGKLQLYDPLQSASNWGTTDDGVCSYKQGSFHTSLPKGNEQAVDCSETTNLPQTTDSAFEAKMTILTGDCGGLTMFAASNQGIQYYNFSLCFDGSYVVLKAVAASDNPTIVASSDNSIAGSNPVNAGLNQTNIVDIVTQGSMLSTFVNGKEVANVSINPFVKSSYGLDVSAAIGDATDVSYRDAKIWAL